MQKNTIDMILTVEHFHAAPVRVAGISQLSQDKPTDKAIEIMTDINAYIEMYEPLYLAAVIGDAQLEDHPEVVEILGGVGSPLALYVYFHYMRDNATFNTISGEKIKNTEYSTAASLTNRLVQTWNIMIRANHKIAEMLGRCDNCGELFEAINSFGL